MASAGSDGVLLQSPAASARTPPGVIQRRGGGGRRQAPEGSCARPPSLGLCGEQGRSHGAVAANRRPGKKDAVVLQVNCEQGGSGFLTKHMLKGVSGGLCPPHTYKPRVTAPVALETQNSEQGISSDRWFLQ